MGDSWHFDPNKDYMADDDEYSGRNNFQRFKNKKNKKNKNMDDDYSTKKGKKNSKWR